MTPFQVYLLVTAGNIGTFLQGIGILGLAALIMFFIMSPIMFDGDIDDFFESKIYKKIRLVVIICLSSFFLSSFVPSTKEMVAIFGIPMVLNNKELTGLPPKLLEYANITLDDLIEEKSE